MFHVIKNDFEIQQKFILLFIETIANKIIIS